MGHSKSSASIFLNSDIIIISLLRVMIFYDFKIYINMIWGKYEKEIAMLIFTYYNCNFKNP